MSAAVLGRAADVSQIALGAVVLRPLFRWLRRRHPTRLERTRHEPFAARGESFVRAVGLPEKAAFLAKMLGSDGGWEARDDVGPAAQPAPGAPEGGAELLLTGDVLYPGALDAQTLSPALRARIRAAAAIVVNLEGTLGEQPHELAPLLTWRGVTQLLRYERDPTGPGWASRLDRRGLSSLLGDARAAVVSVANNHTLDDGAPGFERTVRTLEAMGATVVGDATAGQGAAMVDVGRARVGLLALTYGSNRLAAGGPHHLGFDGVPYRLDHARLTPMVARLGAAGATHLVALLHWGHEHEHEPAPEQRRVVETLLAAGFGAVVGHHPHLLQRSESSRGLWVSYSLGDFVGGDRTIWSRFGAMASLRFGASGAVHGEVIPTVQTPFWRGQRTMLLDEAPRFERAVFQRFFRGKCP